MKLPSDLEVWLQNGCVESPEEMALSMQLVSEMSF